MVDSQALALNNVISNENKNVFEMLSKKGQEIFFPKQGILAQSAQAKGKEINATIGEAIADNGKSMYLQEFDNYLKLEPENIFPYAPSFGKPDLRALWKTFIYKKNPSLGDQAISLPIATNGLTHAISMSAYMFVDETDTVLIPDLFWENYDLIFNKAYGATIQTFNLFKGNALDLDAFDAALQSITSKKIVLLLNFPNNPTGYTPTISEVDAIQKSIAKVAEQGKNVVVIIDDAYFGLVYESGIFTESIFTKLCNLSSNVLAVKLDGPTKEDYVWGFRVGFLSYGIQGGTPALYDALEGKTAGAVRGNISNISNLSQSLLYKVYQSAEYDTYKKEKFDTLHSRYKALQKALSSNDHSKYYETLPYNSGYFMCIRVKDGIEGEKVRQVLLEKYSTGVIVFGSIIRLAFSAVPEVKIEKLVQNLNAACADVANA